MVIRRAKEADTESLLKLLSQVLMVHHKGRPDLFKAGAVKYREEELKELLKECRNILKEQNFYRNTPVETDTTYRTRCLRKQELLTKIDEVLK
jgi:hypothetical protein